MSLLPKRRRWTEEGEKALQRYYNEGTPLAFIAQRLRRSAGAVRIRAVKLGLIVPGPARKRGRGSGIQTKVDGILFDSKIEAKHYKTLKLLEISGTVSSLRLQVKFPLFAWTLSSEIEQKVKVCDYIADFVYIEDGEEVVVDVKPARRRRKNGTLYADRATAVYKLKAKLFRANYGKDIQEVRL